MQAKIERKRVEIEGGIERDSAEKSSGRRRNFERRREEIEERERKRKIDRERKRDGKKWD